MRAFTLIELLIVVAIVAILAAVAVPNFLEAQTRAKVARAKSDLRTIATGLEAYAVDANAFPIDGNFPNDGQARWLPPTSLTTPVAYVSLPSPDAFVSKLAVDPGNMTGDEGVFNDAWFRQYRYRSVRYTYRQVPVGLEFFGEKFGGWLLSSSGPDRDVGPLAFESPSDPFEQPVPYDPTNGSVSRGDILRTQKRPL